MQQLKAQGSAVLLITHDFKLAHYCADRVAILRDGQIAATGVFRRREGRAGSEGRAASGGAMTAVAR